MTIRFVAVLGCAAATLTAGALARAQDEPREAAPPAPPAGIAGEVPPADRPLFREVPHAELSVEGGAGVAGYVGGTASAGPAWQVRVSGAVDDRFSIEGTYTGSMNRRVDNDGTLVTTQLDAGARYNLTTADEGPVQPFVTAGVGVANYAGKNGKALSVILPVGIGADRMLTPTIRVGARINYRPAFFDDLSTPRQRAAGSTPGGDTWALIANLGGNF